MVAERSSDPMPILFNTATYLFDFFQIPHDERGKENSQNVRDGILTSGIPVRFSSSASRCLPSRRSSNRSLMTGWEWAASRALTHFVNVFFCISPLSATSRYNHQFFSTPFVSYFCYIYREPIKETAQHPNACLCLYSVNTLVDVWPWPWPLTSDLENPISQAHSHGEYLCQFSLKYIPYGRISFAESESGLDSVNPSTQCANPNQDSRIQRIQFWHGFTSETEVLSSKNGVCDCFDRWISYSCFVELGTSEIIWSLLQMCTMFLTAQSNHLLVSYVKRKQITMRSLSTTTTNPGHSFCQWIQIRIHYMKLNLD